MFWNACELTGPPAVVESIVTKYTSEDTQDSGVQFIMPVGPRGISSQQGPQFLRPRFYILALTGYPLVIYLVLQHADAGRINNYNMQVQALSLI